MEGLVTINNIDIYTEYGAFLAETSATETNNMNELLKLPPAKVITQVGFRERNGVELPENLDIKFESIERTLQFCIQGDNDADRLNKYNNFCNALTAGLLNINVTGYRLYKMVYQEMPTAPVWYKTFSGKSTVVFKITFLEPNPLSST